MTEDILKYNTLLPLLLYFLEGAKEVESRLNSIHSKENH